MHFKLRGSEQKNNAAQGSTYRNTHLNYTRKGNCNIFLSGANVQDLLCIHQKGHERMFSYIDNVCVRLSLFMCEHWTYLYGHVMYEFVLCVWTDIVCV